VASIGGKATNLGHGRFVSEARFGYAVIAHSAGIDTIAHEIVTHVLLKSQPLVTPCAAEPVHSADRLNITAGGNGSDCPKRLTPDSLRRLSERGRDGRLLVDRLEDSQIQAIRAAVLSLR
jgi:hypothetical protein